MNIIYKLINIINGMIYIGQTWLTLKQRWNNGNGYRYCPYIDNAITKYGKENFIYEILTVCSTQETADYWEDYFIEKYDSRNREKGYNLREGGSRGKVSEETKRKISMTEKGKILSEESKQKISVSNTGKTRTDETKQKMSKAHIGNPASFKGKTQTEDAKARISAALKGIKKSEETKQKMSKAKKGIIPVNKGQYKITNEQIIEIKKMFENGYSTKEIASKFGISTTSALKYKSLIL